MATSPGEKARVPKNYVGDFLGVQLYITKVDELLESEDKGTGNRGTLPQLPRSV